MDFLGVFADIDHIFFRISDYQMSYIEFFGTILGLISVWLATKENIHTWTTGILNVIAFFIIYYQIRLYSDMFLQVFFLGSSIFGLWQWREGKNIKSDITISFIKRKYLPGLILSMLIFTLALGYFISGIHFHFPRFFRTPAAFPYADALAAILSVYATFLMAYKKIECWVLWIIVDIISIILYFQKGVLFISIEYIIFLMMAGMGLYQWLKSTGNAHRISIG
jgi:nicotinamide mononucleotide transporter